MVAIVRGPSYYDPRRHAERVLERRNLVLKVLAEQGVVKPAEAERAMKAPLGITDNAGRSANYFPAFLDLVRRQLREDYPEQALTETGLTVFSTLDPLLQEKAEDALSDELDAAGQGRPQGGARASKASMVVTTPQTGEVVAVVGGRRASFDGFNRALDMKRPIGSLAKPMVYLAALQSGSYTPASVVMDEPVELKLESGDVWKPNNYDKKVHGQVHAACAALTQSYNLATVNLGMDVGPGPVAKTYVQLGLDEAPPKYPSIMLGTAQLNPVEVAQMYNTLANGGFRSPLRAVRAVIDEHGKPLKAPELEVAEAAPAEAVYTLDRMLIEVFERGTARPAQQVAAAGPGRRGQDRHVERLPRQLVRRVLRRPPDRRVDGPRRQLADRPHRHDGRAAGLDAADVVDHDHLVRAADARGRRGSLDRVLLGPGDLAVLLGLGRQHAVRGRAPCSKPSPACPPGTTPEEAALMQPPPPDAPAEDDVTAPTAPRAGQPIRLDLSARAGRTIRGRGTSMRLLSRPSLTVASARASAGCALRPFQTEPPAAPRRTPPAAGSGPVHHRRAARRSRRPMPAEPVDRRHRRRPSPCRANGPRCRPPR